MTSPPYAALACAALLHSLWLPVHAQSPNPQDAAAASGPTQTAPSPHLHGLHGQATQKTQGPQARTPKKTTHKKRKAEPQKHHDMGRMKEMHDMHHKQHMQHMQQMQSMHAPKTKDPMPIGQFFMPSHWEAAKNYYSQTENKGFCPPGLAKKGTDCLPPGQAKLWRKGEPLPRGLAYYDLPRSAVIALGVPPAGYKYVRVASDILLIATGTGLVIDALTDLVQ